MGKERLELLYKLVIENKNLSFQILKNNGFSEEEIKIFLEQGILEKTTTEYKLTSTSGLYRYAVKLIFSGNPKIAYSAFLKCFELDSQNREYCIQLILFAVKNNQYNQAFELFNQLEKISGPNDQYDNNFYLYLLSLLTGCPEEYVSQLDSIDFDSVQIPYNSDILNKQQTNNVRQAIMRNQYKHALHIQNELIALKRIYSPKDELLKELIIQVIRSQEKFENQLLEFVKKQDYRAIISFIETRRKKRYLSNEETYILLLSKTLKNVIETNVLPPITINSTQYIYDAIIGNNYKLAEKLEDRFIRHTRIKTSDEIIKILLSEINQKILEISQKDLQPSEGPKSFQIVKKQN